MKKRFEYILLIILIGFIHSECPDGLIEDECGECWQSYCYCLSDHIPNFDISQEECEENSCWWIGPGGTYEPGDYEFCLFDPYWNVLCTGCTDINAENYDSNATIPCDDNCNEEIGDCCEYPLNNNTNDSIKNLKIKKTYPNPFNPEIQMSIDVPVSDILKIEIYDILGQKVESLHNKYIPKGMHNFIWNAQNKQSGIYIIKVSINQKTDTQFIHLLK